MSVKHNLFELANSHKLTIHYACELKGNGFGYGDRSHKHILYMYSYPFWYYYGITNTSPYISSFFKKGVKYTGIDILKVGDEINQNSMYIYRALKCEQVHANLFNVCDELMNVYIHRDDPESIANSIGISYPHLQPPNHGKYISVYDHLENIHILLYYRMLKFFKTFPVGDLRRLVKSYVEKDRDLEPYVKRISTLIESSRENPQRALKMTGPDHEIIDILTGPPKHYSTRTPAKREISEMLNLLMERLLRS